MGSHSKGSLSDLGEDFYNKAEVKRKKWPGYTYTTTSENKIYSKTYGIWSRQHLKVNIYP